jgi:hypothetical protein
MTLSKQDREKSFQAAVAGLLDELGERAIDSVYFDPKNPSLANVIATTWKELVRQNVLREEGTLAGVDYRFTGDGWYFAMQTTGRTANQSFVDSLSKITAALKDSVKGRHLDGFVYADSLAIECNISIDLVYNVIESGAIEKQFGGVGATWADRQRGTLIHVPLDFGMETL